MTSKESTTPVTKLYKIIVVGDSGIGKSNLLMAYTSTHEEEHRKYVFSDNHASTIGIDFRFKIIKRNNEIIKLQLWDTAGQEIFNSITNSYYKGSNGVIIMYDITDAMSFENVTKWLDIVLVNNPDIKIILVGTKLDLKEDRTITYEDAMEFAKSRNISYEEVSSKTYENVDKVFEKMIVLLTPPIPVIKIEAEKKAMEIKENHVAAIKLHYPLMESKNRKYRCC